MHLILANPVGCFYVGCEQRWTLEYLRLGVVFPSSMHYDLSILNTIGAEVFSSERDSDITRDGFSVQ